MHAQKKAKNNQKVQELKSINNVSTVVFVEQPGPVTP